MKTEGERIRRYNWQWVETWWENRRRWRGLQNTLDPAVAGTESGYWLTECSNRERFHIDFK